MAANERLIKASPDEVFAVLADGWLYPNWVVGASRMRAVDENFPQVGSKLYHSVGVWPQLIDDTTSVLEWDPPRRMVLQARGWPMGEARVTIVARADAGGTRVRILEDAVAGPGKLVPAPVRAATLKARNTETLNRLAMLAEGGAARRGA